ncbi:bifunctional 2-keto-4-hydroxyglutarate aldolase/2-keto-3-deoxy-6-phosphogluconate aldolase [Caldicellulosiruptoraceae bacterium PP1]
MDKEMVLKKIHENGLVVVVRADSKEKALKIVEACKNGGAGAIEITFTVPHAEEIIRHLTEKYSDQEILIGAGTVLDAETARIAIMHGAKYVVSPYLNQELVKMCNRYKVACMPGAMTMKEVVESLEAGADVVKIFPAEFFGPRIIEAFRGPLPQAKLMPTGGVDLNNVEDWIKAKAFAVGVGSVITKYASKDDYQAISDICKQFIEKINNAKRSCNYV